ncbi:hypothetical protein EON65_25350 [archaeon]|nr:MAG: hypothetical protein EON65_25350 [archaeon]
MSRGQFDECRVILNTAQAVDNELERKSITAQVRGRVLVDLPSGGSDTLDFDVEAAVSTGSDDVFQSVSSVSVAEMQLIYMHTIEL